MRWAVNHRDEHVRADAPGVYSSFALRCPVCRERVFARRGPIREAHFAHYDGNSSKTCEQYSPGEGVVTSLPVTSPKPVHAYAKRAFGAPALLWRADQSFPISLHLRLPSIPGGFASNVKVISRATAQFRGKDLARPAFASLRLHVPPAECETTPSDPALEALINETLSYFRFSGNYFRVTSEGGVLEPPDSPLELGEDYWLVTQAPLREPVLGALRIYERRSDRAWFAYRIGLHLVEGEVFEVLRDLAAYLQREIIRPRPKVNLVWPTPDRLDPDGVPVFDISASEVVVRSAAGIPQCIMEGGQPVSGEPIAESLFVFRFDGKAREALIGVPQGSQRRLRFDACELSYPAGVVLHLDDQSVQAFDPRASELLVEATAVSVEVPSHRIWRNVRVNGVALRPLPDGTDYAVSGLLHAFSAGSFGEAHRPPEMNDDLAQRPWHVAIERFVAHIVAPRARERLKQVQNKSQLIRWACEYEAQAILPKLLSVMSAEVTRGLL